MFVQESLAILKLTKTIDLHIHSASYINSEGVGFCLHLAITISLLREIFHLAFPISVHLVLNLNVGMIVAMFSVFPYIQC